MLTHSATAYRPTGSQPSPLNSQPSTPQTKLISRRRSRTPHEVHRLKRAGFQIDRRRLQRAALDTIGRRLQLANHHHTARYEPGRDLTHRVGFTEWQFSLPNGFQVRIEARHGETAGIVN